MACLSYLSNRKKSLYPLSFSTYLFFCLFLLSFLSSCFHFTLSSFPPFHPRSPRQPPSHHFALSSPSFLQMTGRRVVALWKIGTYPTRLFFHLNWLINFRWNVSGFRLLTMLHFMDTWPAPSDNGLILIKYHNSQHSDQPTFLSCTWGTSIHYIYKRWRGGGNARTFSKGGIRSVWGKCLQDKSALEIIFILKIKKLCVSLCSSAYSFM